MISRRDRVLAGLGWLVFGAVLVGWLCQYGVRWEFGPRWGVPVPIVRQAADGRNVYADGSPAIGVDVALDRTGCAESIMGTLIGGLALGVAGFVWKVRADLRRLRRELEEATPAELLAIAEARGWTVTSEQEAMFRAAHRLKGRP
jgi:hypothetical protein